MASTPLGLPYPELISPNNPPADFKALAEGVDALITQDRKTLTSSIATAKNDLTAAIITAKNDVSTGIYVNGYWYKDSGILRFDNLGGWTIASSLYSYRKLMSTVPYTPPAGYAFKYEVVFSSHMCLIAGGDMWNNDAAGEKSDAYILRMWNSTDAESLLIVRWSLYKKS